MTEKEMRQELVRALTGYDGCVDCDSCQFVNCCYERELVNKLWRDGWRKVPTARWEYFPSTGTLYRCSNCKSRIGRRTPWCGQCGAEMEGYVQ